MKTTISIKDFTDVIAHPNDWFQNARPIALPQSLLPAISAIAVAFAFSTINNYDFNIYLAILSVIGIVFGHLGSNLFDDYFDYRDKGIEYREEVIHKGMRARIGKCVYLKSGKNTLQQLFAASVMFSAAAIIIGTIIWHYRGDTIIALAAITAFLGITYSGTPIKFSYRGLGEIIIGITFGPLAMSGVFFAATAEFSYSILYLSAAVGLLVTNIIYTHSILDIDADREVNKKTFAVLLKNKKAMLAASLLINILPFIIVACGVALNHLHQWYLAVFITLPQAVALFYLVQQFHKNPFKTFSPKYWYGPMEGWEMKKKYGVDWFLIRWMLARNLTAFFSIIITIVSICVAIF